MNELFADVHAIEQPGKRPHCLFDAVDDNIAVCEIAATNSLGEPVGDVLESVLVIADNESFSARSRRLIQPPGASRWLQ